MRFSRTLLALLLLLSPFQVQAKGLGDRLVAFSDTQLGADTVVDLQHSIGNEPVMLVFWASWCPNCKKEAPKINRLQARYLNNGLRIIGINVGHNDTRERAVKFMEEYAMTYPNVFDEDHAITDSYRVMGVPTIFIADKDGVIRYKNYAVPELDDAAVSRLNRP